MPHSARDADLLIVGSGIMGSAIAQLVSEAAPRARIVMVDGGQVIGSVPGQHLHDIAEPRVREAYIRQASPGIQSMYLGAEVTPSIGHSVQGAKPGMYHLSAFGEKAESMPASAFAWNVGGMGVHWTAATPWPWGREVFAFDGLDVWNDDLVTARRLLRVHDRPFGLPTIGSRVLEALDAVFGEASAEGRGPQPMPMAVSPNSGGRMPRTGPNRIFPRMTEPDGDDFTLIPGALAVRLIHDGGVVRGAWMRDIDSGEEYEILAAATVVAADPIRTPQLLFASGIRPPALGRYLNEHALLTGQVLADLDRLGVAIDDIPRPEEGEWLVGSYWLPHSDSAQPFHGQIMDRLYFDEAGRRLAYSVGLSLYVPTEIRAENRLLFDDEARDAAGMPRITVDFALSPTDNELIETARLKQRAAAEMLGEFEPARDSALLAQGSSLHFTGTARAGSVDDGTSVCDPDGRVWGFSNLYLSGGAVVPTAIAGNTTLTAMITAVRASRAILPKLAPMFH